MIEKHYKYKVISTSELLAYKNNARTHSDNQVKQIANSINEFGFTNPLLINDKNTIIAGHGRLLAAKQLNLNKLPCVIVSNLSPEQEKALIIADNQLALNAGWDLETLKLEIDDLKLNDFDIDLLGFDDDFITDLFDDDGVNYADGLKGQMSADFGFAPFTVFNAREGGWQKRKQYWLNKGIKSEVGRDAGAFSTEGCLSEATDTSIFDPVLCEIGYEWFTPKGGLILDPFAGGSVRGIVAAECGREYIGNDLNNSQIVENRKQADDICRDIIPVWTNGDSMDIKKLVGNVRADAIFSCPPYADLEVYSDDPSDISNMPYSQFIENYSHIIKESFDLLKDDSFAVWVIGEVRDKKGNYYNFVGDTITAFKAAGFNYYNEAILVTAVGSLPLRAGRTMKVTRKLGKTHQNVLVFVKGCGKRAANRCGDINIHINESDYEE